jgi:hypothetical protein
VFGAQLSALWLAGGAGSLSAREKGDIPLPFFAFPHNFINNTYQVNQFIIKRFYLTGGDQSDTNELLESVNYPIRSW